MSIIPPNFYKCGKCGYYQPAFKLCVIKRINVNAEDCACNIYTQETPVCDNCHNYIQSTPLYWTREDGKVLVLCQNCFQRM